MDAINKSIDKAIALLKNESFIPIISAFETKNPEVIEKVYGAYLNIVEVEPSLRNEKITVFFDQLRNYLRLTMKDEKDRTDEDKTMLKEYLEKGLL